MAGAVVVHVPVHRAQPWPVDLHAVHSDVAVAGFGVVELLSKGLEPKRKERPKKRFGR